MSLAEQLSAAQRDLFSKIEEDRARYQALLGLSIRLGSISSDTAGYDQAVATIQADFDKLEAQGLL